jgi:hypothetical protein
MRARPWDGDEFPSFLNQRLGTAKVQPAAAIALRISLRA